MQNPKIDTRFVPSKNKTNPPTKQTRPGWLHMTAPLHTTLSNAQVSSPDQSAMTTRRQNIYTELQTPIAQQKTRATVVDFYCTSLQTVTTISNDKDGCNYRVWVRSCGTLKLKVGTGLPDAPPTCSTNLLGTVVVK